MESGPLVTDADASADLKEAARMEMQLLLQTREMLIAETVAGGRWTQASLLVINGGAAIAILSLELGIGRLVAGAFFAAGVLLAIWTASLNATASLSILGPLGEQIGYWLAVAHDGERDEEKEAKHKADGESMRLSARPAKWAAYASAVCFAVGCIAVGFSLPA